MAVQVEHPLLHQEHKLLQLFQPQEELEVLEVLLQAMGLVAEVGGMCMWDEGELDMYDFALCAAGCQPDMPVVCLNIINFSNGKAIYMTDSTLHLAFSRHG
jgi:hypothetical protein